MKKIFIAFFVYTLICAGQNITIETVDGRFYENATIVNTNVSGMISFRTAKKEYIIMPINGLTSGTLLTLGYGSSINSFAQPKPNEEYSGSRKSACPVCRGFGYIVCPACHGGKFGQRVAAELPCPSCGGRGSTTQITYTKMNTLSYGRIGQARIIPSGSYNQTCSRCNGAGKEIVYQSTYCQTCGGRGSIRCSKCGGSGVAKDFTAAR